MVEVDPTGLVSSAKRIAAALADLGQGDPVHPRLGADPASVGAAARLSAAGSTLAAALADQAAGLAATAEQLEKVGVGFAAAEETIASNIATLSTAGTGPIVAGWAPPSPTVPPDVRPALGPPSAVSGEAIAAAVHSGDPNAGESFISAWTAMASRAEDIAGVVRSTADHLTQLWNSPESASTVRAHLIRYAQALDASAARARTLVEQASRHGRRTVRARSDIPRPQTFADVNNQLQVMERANAQSGGADAIPLARLLSQKGRLEARAIKGYSAFHTDTDAATAGDGETSDDDAPGGEPGSDATPADGTEPGLPGAGAAVPGLPGVDAAAGPLSAENAGELAAMLPGMIGAVGGLVAGAVSTIGKVPEALLQAGTEAAGAATQTLSGLMTSMRHDSSDVGPLGDSPSSVGTGGETTPAAAGASGTPPAMSWTGPPPRPPTTPTGGLPEPVAPPAAGGAAMMPMGTPLGGMMPGAAGGGTGQDRPARPKKLVVPPKPHTESVTGKAHTDRIAVSMTAAEPPRNPEPPGDQPPQPRGPIVRRITMPTPRNDQS